MARDDDEAEAPRDGSTGTQEEVSCMAPVCAEPASPFTEPHAPKYGLVAKLLLLCVCLAAGACCIALDSNEWVGCFSSGVFWTIFYLLLVNQIVDSFPSSRTKCADGSTQAELCVCLLHQIGLCGALLWAVLFLHIDNDWDDWWKDGPVYAFTLERQVQLAIFGYELKDFAYGCVHWTWIVHHSFTLFGCVFVLLMPAGLGLLTLNGIFAELGSAVYNASMLCPSGASKWVYFIGMFISNGVVVALTVLLFYIDDMAVGWKVGYAIIVGLLFLLRSEGLRRAMSEHFADDTDSSQKTPSNIDDAVHETEMSAAAAPTEVSAVEDSDVAEVPVDVREESDGRGCCGE